MAAVVAPLRFAALPASSQFQSRSRVSCRASLSSAEQEQRLVAARDLEAWLKGQGFPQQPLRPSIAGDIGLGFVAERNLQAGDDAICIPEMYTITTMDVASHPVVSHAAAGREEMIALTLWLLYERWRSEDSPWYAFVRLLPGSTLSPLLWSDAERDDLLKGSPTLGEVKQQLRALEAEFHGIQELLQGDSKGFPLGALRFDDFKAAFAVVLSRAFYLPSADVCALVPFADLINHESSSPCLDYDVESQNVLLKINKSYKQGEAVTASYASSVSNADLLIKYGFVDQNTSGDYIDFEADLVPSDPLKNLKRDILQSVGLAVPQKFPVFLDRFPSQFLSYIRLARIQDSSLIAKISFEEDSIVNEANEYEVLMLLMSECRAKLMAYAGTMEEEFQILRRKNLTCKEKLAAQLRLSEKAILTSFMGGLRNRLAPIRGVPTKSGGLRDPNSDIKEMFGMVEQVASAPRKFLSDMFGKKQ